MPYRGPTHSRTSFIVMRHYSGAIREKRGTAEHGSWTPVVNLERETYPAINFCGIRLVSCSRDTFSEVLAKHKFQAHESQDLNSALCYKKESLTPFKKRSAHKVLYTHCF